MTGVAIGVVVYAMRYDLPRLHEPANLGLVWRLIPAFVISFVDRHRFAGELLLAVRGGHGRHRRRAGPFSIPGSLSSEAEGHEEQRWKRACCSFRLLSLLLIAIGPLGQAFQTTNLSGKLGVWLISILPDSQIILLHRCGGSVDHSRDRLAYASCLPDCGAGSGPVHDSDWHRPAAGALLRILFCRLRNAISAGCRVCTRGGKNIGFRFLGNRDAFDEACCHDLHHPVCLCIQSRNHGVSQHFVEDGLGGGGSADRASDKFDLPVWILQARTDADRTLWVPLAVLLGYTAIMRPEVMYTYLAYGLTLGLMAWVWLRPARV